jgi:PAS domain S-box-containing protein
MFSGIGVRERDSYRNMSHTKQTRRVTPASSEMLLSLLETLPGALFVVDDAATIVYTNARAQAMTGATREELRGNPFWPSAPQLVSTALYQAVLKTRQTQEPAEVEYGSPMTRTWLHVQLAPTVGGVMLHFHHRRAPARRQEMVPTSQPLSAAVLDGLHAGIAVLTPEGIVLEINEAPLDGAHLRREEVIGQPLAQTPWWSFTPAGQEQLRAAIARASTGETVRFETLVHPREGMLLHLEVAITPQVNADHHIEYLVITGIDITARKRAEEEIRVLVDAIPQLVWMTRPDGSAEYCNQRWCDYTGMTCQQAQGDGWLQAIHPDDQHPTLLLWQRAVQTGRPYEAELRLRQGTTGDYRWFLVRAVPFTDAQGQIVKWFGTCTDIQEQKRTEQQLTTSEENLRVLAETLPQLVWTTGPDNRLDYCNQRYCEYTHATFEQLQGHGWRQFLHPEDDQGVMALRHQTLETGEPFESECRLRNGQTGTYRWFLARGTPVRDERGQIVKWFGTNTDIEEQKRIEEALRQSQERIRALIDSNIIGIASNEGEEEVVAEANDAWLHMTGYTREDVRSRTLTRVKITPPEQAPLFERALQELAAHGQHTPFETEVVCKDGSRLPILAGGVTFQDHPRQIVAFVLDNSARKELERRKDAFIGMASHELRTPLTALKLQTSLLQRQLAKQGIQASAPALSRMEAQINSITRLVEELLDVSKIQAGRLEYRQERVDLDALLLEIADTMHQTHPGHSILVQGAVRASLLGDRDRLGQVFTNLLENSIKYSPDAQTVEIDLSSSPETVTIRVRDHGLGIPREQREKIFERFYRAADPKQRAIPGLGMGLYIVAEIVKRHGGTIAVESAVGKGSTFTVTLPLTRDG